MKQVCYSTSMNTHFKFGLILGATMSLTVVTSLWLTEPEKERYIPETYSIHYDKPKQSVLSTQTIYHTHDKIHISNREKECLARNIYFESGVEPLEGKIAVAQVTFNRLKNGRWGQDICKVVYAKHQFSWTSDKKKLKEQPTGKLWEDSIIAMNKYLSGIRVSNLEHSTHYHATWIDLPKWANRQPIMKIGQHVFYAMK